MTQNDESDTRLRERAREIWADFGFLEIDDDAQVSRSEGGAYVQAWVWVPSNKTP